MRVCFGGVFRGSGSFSSRLLGACMDVVFILFVELIDVMDILE
jgi:hypothetical protein